MIFIVKADGTLEKVFPEAVNQGSVGVNKLILVAPFVADTVVTAACKLPNGIYTKPTLLRKATVPLLSPTEDGESYNAWEFTLDAAVTQYSGTVTVQFFANGNGTVLATYADTFTVAKGVPQELPDTPSADVYNDLLDALSGVGVRLTAAEETIEERTASIGESISALNIYGGAKNNVAQNWDESKGNTFNFSSETAGEKTIPRSAILGDFAAAFGGYSAATGKRAFACGSSTLAEGAYSHTEGVDTYAADAAGHAEGRQSSALGYVAHAEGDRTVASGSTAHAEGYKTKATGNSSHAQGEETTASGFCSYASGKYSVASGEYSSAHGLGTVADGYGQTAVGTYNTRNSNALFVVGRGEWDSLRADAFSINNDGSMTFGGVRVTPEQFAKIVSGAMYVKKTVETVIDVDNCAWTNSVLTVDPYSGSSTGVDQELGCLYVRDSSTFKEYTLSQIFEQNITSRIIIPDMWFKETGEVVESFFGTSISSTSYYYGKVAFIAKECYTSASHRYIRISLEYVEEA